VSYEHWQNIGESGDGATIVNQPYILYIGRMGETMSWKIVNAILGLATVDEKFCRALLLDPLGAVQSQHFELTEEEQKAFKTISATSLSEFSQQLVVLLAKDKK
jgi:hypothetical protein